MAWELAFKGYLEMPLRVITHETASVLIASKLIRSLAVNISRTHSRLVPRFQIASSPGSSACLNSISDNILL